jgi:ribosomal protein S18 acetylase RimI-like enzyme
VTDSDSPTPVNRPGLGDHPGRTLRDPDGKGYIEWRWAPGYGAEIVNIEVSAEHRRTGVGRLLLRQLCDTVSAGGGMTVFAVTRSDNRIAHDWYRAMGFHVAGRLHGFYDAHLKVLDALLFARSCKEPVP